MKNESKINKETVNYVKSILSDYIKDKDKIISRRLENYLYLGKKFEQLGFSERFTAIDNNIPGVFMVYVNNPKIDLHAMKLHFNSCGIQGSVFYGEQAFFIPCHQELQLMDLDYFFEIIKCFLKQYQ